MMTMSPHEENLGGKLPVKSNQTVMTSLVLQDDGIRKSEGE